MEEVLEDTDAVILKLFNFDPVSWDDICKYPEQLVCSIYDSPVVFLQWK